jgi:hypothetical protein
MPVLPQIIPAATTPHGWKVFFTNLLIANGWVMHDDQYTNSGNPSGYVILSPVANADNRGYIQIFIDGTITRLTAWHRWNATTQSGFLASEQLQVTHDLANGFILFLGSSGVAGSAGFVFVLKSVSATTAPLAAVVKKPDYYPTALETQGIEPTRAMILTPNTNVLHVSHWVGMAWGGSGVENIGLKTSQWEMNPGNLRWNSGTFSQWTSLSPFYLGFQLTTQKSTATDLALWNGVLFNMKRSVYKPRLYFGKSEGLNNTFGTFTSAVIIPECVWNELPEIYFGSSNAIDETWAKSVADGGGLILGDSGIWLASAMDAAQLTCVLGGNFASLPVSGVFDLQIEDETVRCSARAGANITITSRGFNSAAVAHAAQLLAPNFTEDFSGALTNFTAEGTTANATLSIVSGKLKGIKNNGVLATIRAVVNGAAFPQRKDFEIEFDYNNQLLTNVTDSHALIQFRRTAANTFYELRIFRYAAGVSQGWSLSKTIAGVTTQLANITPSSWSTKMNAQTGRIKIRVVGQAIRVSLNGEDTYLAVNDTSITAAGDISFGMSLPSAAAVTDFFEFDNIVIRDLTSKTPVSLMEWFYKFGTTFIRYGLGGG